MSLGGWLVRSFAAIFRPHDDDEREVPFPNNDGVYLVRCVAQPRLRGDEDENYILRLPSVAVKTVQVREIQQRTQQELDSQEQNLQANILELLISYRLTTDARQLTTIRQALELKVQEASQSNRSFLETQIAERRQQLTNTEAQIPDDVRQKINEEIEILSVGVQSGSGLLSMIFLRQIALKEAELAEARISNPQNVSRLEREIGMLRRRLGTATAREQEMTESGIQLARPNAVFVNEANGQTIPLLIEIGQIGSRHTTRGYTMRVSDVTGADSDQHDAIGATRAVAVRNALREYANHFPYGRGYMTVRMPATQNFGVTEVVTFRCNPHDTQQASERLDELLQLLAVAGLFIPGVGTAAMAIGAAVSVARLMSRVNNHTFEWDMNAVMDVLNILGAVAGGATHLARFRLVRTQRMFAVMDGADAEMQALVNRLQTITRVAELAEETINNVSYFLGTMETVQNYLEIQRQELRGDISHADARRQRAQLVAHGMFDQFMQHAPTVIEGVRERRDATAAHEPPPHEEGGRIHDDVTPTHPDESSTIRRPDDAPRREPPDQIENPPDAIPVPVPEHLGQARTRPHIPAQTPVPLSPAQRVAAFFRNPQNVHGIVSGNMRTTRELLETHGNWRDLIMHLQGEPGNDIYGFAIENLETMRRNIAGNLQENFGLHLSDRNASTLASSDIDLATSGADAGERMVHAEAFMRDRYGSNWSELLRMNFYTSAERLFIYEQVRHLMSDADFGHLQQEITTLSETLNFAKMLQHAGSNADSVARVEALMAHLTDAQRAEIRTRATSATSPPQVQAAALHLQIDALVARFEALPPNDPGRIELAREITRRQMEANFLTQEAYISPGAGRHVVRGVAVHGHEAYQSALANLEMMEHIMHITGGDIQAAVREYELYKYINRFIEAMTTAGIPMDASMLAYYQASYDVYRNSRTQLQGVTRQDLAWLTGMHNHFMQTAAAVLPQLRQAGTSHPEAWNPEHRSLQTPFETRSVLDENAPGGTREVRIPRGIGDNTRPHAQAEEGNITDADIERSFERTFSQPQEPVSRETPTIPPPGREPATAAGQRIDRSTAGETYFVTDTAHPRFSIRAYIERGFLRIDMRTVLPDGTRSTVLNGTQEFSNIVNFFQGQFEGILSNWQYGTNLNRINELTADDMPVDQAARQAWSAQRAAEHGFTQVRVVEQAGTPGNYSVIKVSFTRP